MRIGFNEKDKDDDFLKTYRSNKYKSKEEDIKSGIEDAMLDYIQKYSKTDK